MPLLQKPTRAIEKHQIRVRLDQATVDEANAYCEWAGLPSIDYFIEQSMLLALKKDKEWVASNKQKRPL